MFKKLFIFRVDYVEFFSNEVFVKTKQLLMVNGKFFIALSSSPSRTCRAITTKEVRGCDFEED